MVSSVHQKIWNGTCDSAMRRLGFRQLKSDECFCSIEICRSTVYVLVCVDHVLVVGDQVVDVTAAKKMSMQEFEMKDFGVAKSFL